MVLADNKNWNLKDYFKNTFVATFEKTNVICLSIVFVRERLGTGHGSGTWTSPGPDDWSLTR